MSDISRLPAEPEKIVSIDAEYLSGRRFAYQEDISQVEEVDLIAATPGADLNWLEDVELLEEEGMPAVFDRYSNSFIKLYFPIPPPFNLYAGAALILAANTYIWWKL